MRRSIGWFLTALVLFVGVAQAKEALLAVRPTQVDNPERFGFVATAQRPEEVAALRAVDSTLISLHWIDFWGVANEPYDSGYRMPTWQVPDSLWSAQRLIQYWFERNLDGGCDWTLRRVDGSPVVRYNKRCLNFTDCCPRGVVGPTKGLTYREYCQRAFEEVGRRSEFAAAYDGWWLDTMPPACCWPTEYWGVDYNGDGIDDSCPHYSCILARQWNMWIQAEADGAEMFLTHLRSNLPDKIIVTQKNVGQWYPIADGWKLERWLIQYGQSQDFSHWLDLYREAGRVLRAGTSLSVVHVLMPPQWSEARKRQFARFGLGFTYLEDGWFAAEVEHGVYYDLPEAREWKLGEPITEPYLKINSRRPATAVDFCRVYKNLDGRSRYATVVVDTLAHDARLVPRWLAPDGPLPKRRDR